jgi:hypothetical protein
MKAGVVVVVAARDKFYLDGIEFHYCRRPVTN